jgi:hypothetical protein
MAPLSRSRRVNICGTETAPRTSASVIVARLIFGAFTRQDRCAPVGIGTPPPAWHIARSESHLASVDEIMPLIFQPFASAMCRGFHERGHIDLGRWEAGADHPHAVLEPAERISDGVHPRVLGISVGRIRSARAAIQRRR